MSEYVGGCGKIEDNLHMVSCWFVVLNNESTPACAIFAFELIDVIVKLFNGKSE